MEKKEIRDLVRASVKSEMGNELKKTWRKVASIILSVVALAFLAVVIFMIRKGRLGSEAVSPPIQGIQVDVMSEQATVAARGYLESESMGEKAQYVCEARRVLPLMKRYYETHPFDSRKFKRLKDTKYHVATGREFIMGRVSFQDSSIAPEMWVFEKEEDGVVRLQWEVAVGHSDLDWATFLDDRDTQGGRFRVLLEMADYYNFEYSDKEAYQSFMIRAPGSERYVYGYLDRQSPAYKQFVAVRLMSNLQSMPVIAILRFPINDRANGEQVIVAEIDSCSWVEGVDM